MHIDYYKNKEIFFDEHIYMFKYKNIRKNILDYKFNDKSYYYKAFVNILLKDKKMCEILKSYDIIVPVPIHNKRRMERGYNQTELIAKELSRKINYCTNTIIKIKEQETLRYENILIKKNNTKPQSSLNKIQRAENAKNVYKLRKNKRMILEYEKIKNKNILIFDDIYTTGATANECAKVINEELAPNKIGILTMAKD